MLTPKQSALLRYLSSWQDEGNGVSPSYKQMQSVMGLKSKSGIHRLITSLEERGYIERIPNRARAIHVIARPGEKPHPTVTAQDLLDLVARLNTQEGPEVTIAALADASARVAALFRSTEGNA